MVPDGSGRAKSTKWTGLTAPRAKPAIAFCQKCNVVLTVGVSENWGTAMEDKDSILKKVEDAVKDAAKAVEDFADEVAAPQEPVVIVPDKEPSPEPPAAGKKDG